ncbi:MAG: type II toxin-antitoxin system HicA family toxin [Armatimonadetes bacterium]|nr:type II toxin-antitoxin system HicA family toxin [Armatimonadota bacterium]
MNEKLPRVTASQIVRVLENAVFRFARQSGSHKIYKNAEGKRATVPYHEGKTLHPKVLKSIMTDADLTAQQLREWL